MLLLARTRTLPHFNQPTYHHRSHVFPPSLVVFTLFSLSSFILCHRISTQVDTNELIDSQQLLPSSSIEEASEEKEFILDPKEQIDCIFVKTEEGKYTYRASGESNIICGLYLITKPDSFVEIEFLEFDVDCNKNSLVSVVDGWELSGQFFPGIEDHAIPRNARYHEFCGNTKPRRIFRMSQNVGLVEYRIPNPGQGFVVRVRFVKNPRPCNAVIQDFVGIYTLRNYGERTNCTISIIFPAVFHILSMNIGQSYRPMANMLAMRNYIIETNVIKKCKKRGMHDYVEFRGGNGLDPKLMTVAEDMCGVRSLSFKRKFTVHCSHTAVRLVSSGKYDNLVEFAFKIPFDSNPPASLVCSSGYK